MPSAEIRRDAAVNLVSIVPRAVAVTLAIIIGVPLTYYAFIVGAASV
jgi:hypothetical protein